MSDMQFQSAPEKENDTESRMALARRPDQIYCRDCGKLISRSASVCAHCGYVMNPAALHQTEEFIRQRARTEQKNRTFSNLIRYIGGESRPQVSQQPRPVQRVHYEITGEEFCPNCGQRVDIGTSVCVHCKHMIDPAAIYRAQLMVRDRMAKLTKKEWIACLLIPGKGRRYYERYRETRPQIAKPCRIAGIINTVALVVLALLILFMGWH